MKLWHIVLAVFMAILWGFGFVTSKYAADNMPPLFFLALRFVAVSLILIWFVKIPYGYFKPVLLFAVTMGVGHFGLFYIALQLGVEASTAAIIWQTQIPITVFLAAVILNDRPGFLAIFGIAISFGGVFLLVGEPRHLGNISALGIMLASSAMWAIANIQAKKLTDIEPLTLNAWMSVFSAIVLLVCSIFIESNQLKMYLVADWRLQGSLIYQVVGSTILAYWIWYFLLRRYPVSQITGFMLLVPFFGFLSGIFALGDIISWTTALGGIITLIGVAMIILPKQFRSKRMVASGEKHK